MQAVDPKSIKLTETVKKGGCAAKLPAGELSHILKRLDMKRPELLKVGTEKMDDACVWDLQNGQSLIQTLDFFTPIVDDAYDFGAIAATNALSDVYAMGGDPKIALSILAFPSQTLPLELCEDLLRGALDKVHEAGACLAGGHTIDDDTLKFGLSITGFADSNRVWTNAGAKPGDKLILTKALGTGTITTALKNREAKSKWVSDAIKSMTTLNKVPELLKGIEVHAATDVTGFGLCGHLLQMMRASGTSAVIDMKSVPILEGARECLADENINRAHKTNLNYVSSEADFGTISQIDKWLTVDPQTSGGLLLAVSESEIEKVINILKSSFGHTTCIGTVDNPSGPFLSFRNP